MGRANIKGTLGAFGILTHPGETILYCVEGRSQVVLLMLILSLYSTVHLVIHSLSMECSWDYLHVFSGGSLYSQKVAAFT